MVRIFSALSLSFCRRASFLQGDGACSCHPWKGAWVRAHVAWADPRLCVPTRGMSGTAGSGPHAGSLQGQRLGRSLCHRLLHVLAQRQGRCSRQQRWQRRQAGECCPAGHHRADPLLAKQGPTTATKRRPRAATALWTCACAAAISFACPTNCSRKKCEPDILNMGQGSTLAAKAISISQRPTAQFQVPARAGAASAACWPKAFCAFTAHIRDHGAPVTPRTCGSLPLAAAGQRLRRCWSVQGERRPRQAAQSASW